MNAPSADTILDIEELRRGFGLPWLIVMDDFLRDPDEVRSRALELSYEGHGYYPGRTSREKIPFEGLTENMARLVHEPLHTPWTQNYSHQSCVWRWPRMTRRAAFISIPAIGLAFCA